MIESINNKMKITKAVISAAGFGTRFLPAAKAVPKELLPLIDKPIIQYIVEEAVDSGINQVIIVIRKGLEAIQRHFVPDILLEATLKASGKFDLFEKVKKISRMAKFTFLYQTDNFPYGNGSPLLVAKNYLGENESFAYLFGDDLVKSKIPATKQLIDLWEKNNFAPVVATQEIPKSESSRYGIVKLKKGSQNLIEDIIEKPEPKNSPSNLAEFGRFILNKEIVHILEKRRLGKAGELWLVDAITDYAKDHPVIAAKIEGKWLTTGDPLRYLKATVEYALDRQDLGKEFKDFLQDLLKSSRIEVK